MPIEPAYAPFCSDRCRLLDLGRWLDEAYRIPAKPVPFQADSDVEDEHERD
jgi:endogenous inhibitor of DNA gyrase (YacG/DUF329 family)